MVLGMDVSLGLRNPYLFQTHQVTITSLDEILEPQSDPSPSQMAESVYKP